MKKISTLLVALVIGMAAFAIEDAPYVTQVYEFSALKGNKPNWMHALSERNMAYYNGKIYIPSVENGNQIYIINPSTGLKTDSIALPTRQGTGTPTDSIYGGAVAICGIQITPTGKILVANITTDAKTSNFKVYTVTPKTSGTGYQIATLIDWAYSTISTTQYRCGDHFAMYGDLTAGSTGYIMSANVKDKTVYRWDITNGVASAQPVLITLDGIYPDPTPAKTAIIHLCPVIFPVDQNSFIINSARMHPTLYNMSGVKQSTFDGTAQPKMAGISGVSHFNLNGRSFFVTGTTNYIADLSNPGPVNAFEVFEIKGGEYNLTGATSLGVYPAAGFGSETNTSYNVPIAFNTSLGNYVQFYVMVPNVGFAAYNLSLGAPVSVETPQATNIKISLVPHSGILNFSATMASIELYDLAGQVVCKAQNTNKLTVSGLQGVYIVKAISVQGQLINRKVMVK